MLSSKPKISVIVPVYNTADFLAVALDSLLNQSFKDFELICINDGSQDGSLEILEEYSKKDCRIKVISKCNEGLSVTRNLGLSHAQGDYVCFFDSDDQLDGRTLEFCYELAVNLKLDLVLFDGKSIFETEELAKKFGWYRTGYTRSKEYKGVYTGEELFNQLFDNGDYFVSACMYLFSKKMIENFNIRFIPGILYEDNIFTLELMLKSQRVSHIKLPFYIRSVRQGSIVTKPKTVKNIYSYYYCIIKIYSFIKNSSGLNSHTISNVCSLLQSMLNTVESWNSEVRRANKPISPLDQVILDISHERNHATSNFVLRLKKGYAYFLRNGLLKTLSRVWGDFKRKIKQKF